MKNFTLVEIKYDASNFQDCNVFLTGKELTARKIAPQTLKTHTEQTGYSHPVFALCLYYMEENKVSGLKLLYLGTFKFVIIASLSIFDFYIYLFRQGGRVCICHGVHGCQRQLAEVSLTCHHVGTKDCT